MTDYEKQAQDFLNKTKTEFSFKFLENNKYFDDDEKTRDIYLITLKRGERIYSFKFGNSISNSGKYFIYTKDGLKYAHDEKEKNKIGGIGDQKVKNKNFKEPTAYDVLACLQKYEIGSFKDFCGEFGYNEESIKSLKIYGAVLNEYNNLKMLYSDEELNQMSEIN